MKLKRNIYVVTLAALVVVAGAGCRKGQFNINRDINNPTDSTVTYDVILPAALHNTGAAVDLPWGSIQNWMGYWARSGTYAPNATEESYQITTGFGTGVWNSFYDNNYDYEVMMLKARQAGATFYEGIARIMKAHNFQALVDVYGNIPYRQALKGNANPTPAYELGIDIYKDLFRQIDTGIALIKAAVVSADNPNKNIWTNDIMFSSPTGVIGDVPAMKVKWAKFGNTIKLRMLIHTYAIAGIDKAAEMLKITTEGSGFLGAGENAQVQPGYKSDKPNPFFNLYKTDPAGTQTANNKYYAANRWGHEYYAYNGDARIDRFYEARAVTSHMGVPYGLPPVTANSHLNAPGIGPGLYKTSSSPQWILTSAESLLLQAEGRLRGYITSGPTVKQLVDQAITESFTFVGAGSAAGYIGGNAGYADVDASAPTNVPGNPGGTPAGGLFTILSQKWFALNGINPLEVWTDYRRVPYSEVKAGGATDHFVYGAGVGYDPGPPLSVYPSNTSTKIPVRFLYPQTEYNYNPVNVGAQGVVDRYTRIFWDIN